MPPRRNVDTRSPCKRQRSRTGICRRSYAVSKRTTCSHGNTESHNARITYLMTKYPRISKKKLNGIIHSYNRRAVSKVASGKCAELAGLGNISVRRRNYGSKRHYRLGLDTSGVVKESLRQSRSGRGRRPPRPPANPCAEVERLCHAGETAKRCFRRLSKEGPFRHPDKGGTKEKSQILNNCKDKWTANGVDVVRN